MARPRDGTRPRDVVVSILPVAFGSALTLIATVAAFWLTEGRQAERERAQAERERVAAVRRLDLELKSALADRIVTSDGAFFAAFQSGSTARIDAAYTAWETSAQQVASQLEAYFPESGLPGRWQTFAHHLRLAYFAVRKPPIGRPAQRLAAVAEYLRGDISNIDGILHCPAARTAVPNPTCLAAIRRLLRDVRAREGEVIRLLIGTESALRKL